MKSLLIAVMLFIFPFLAGNLNARVFHVRPGYPALEAINTGVSYSLSARDTSFFYGHKKEVMFKSLSADFSYRKPAGNTYHISFSGFDAELADRKTESPGAGVKASVSGYLAGDYALTSLWQWHLGAAAEEYRLASYRGNKINIDSFSYRINTALTASQEIGPAGASVGLGFFNVYDNYRERNTGLNHKGRMSGFMFFSSIHLTLFDDFGFAADICFADYRVFSLSASVAF